MITGVPGLGIVDDDEDWTDKNALEEFVLNSKQGLTFFFAKQLAFNDEPTYFESDEEALAMVKKHFPGKGSYANLTFCLLLSSCLKC